MQPSADLCRTQQALHLSRAEAATLDNVRRVAESAAKAWGVEAIAADERELRHADALRRRAAKAALDLMTSENPDRGVADEAGGPAGVSFAR